MGAVIIGYRDSTIALIIFWFCYYTTLCFHSFQTNRTAASNTIVRATDRQLDFPIAIVIIAPFSLSHMRLPKATIGSRIAGEAHESFEVQKCANSGSAKVVA